MLQILISNGDYDNEIILNESDMVSIGDKEDMSLRIKQLTGGNSKESSDDSGDENESDSEFLQQIRQDLSFKKQIGKPLNNINNTLASIIQRSGRNHPLRI